MIKKFLTNLKKNIKNFKLNKWELSILFLIPFVYFINYGVRFDNDGWFLLNHGRYVLAHGFPHVEPFTIHKNFHFVMQQWMFAIPLYLLYKKAGFWGISIVTFIFLLIIYYTFYKLCLYVSKNNRIVSTLASVTFCWFMLNFRIFFANRPQMITYLFLILWLFICEHYYKNKNVKILWLLVLLSLLEINFHASCWALFFVFTVPFIIEYIRDSFNNGKVLEEFKLFIIFICLAFAAGFLNPYGAENMIYLSYGLHENTNAVYEMMQVPIIDRLSITMFTFLFIYVLTIAKADKKDLQLRYMFFMIGTLLFSLMTLKSAIYFAIIGLYSICAVLPNFMKNRVTVIKRPKIYKFCYGAVFIVCLCFLSFHTFKNTKKEMKNVTDYRNSVQKDLKSIIKTKNAKVYNKYEVGGIIEFFGYKTYIDPRAEVFYYEMNKKRDIYDEHHLLMICNNDKEREKFMKKYNFTHLFITDKDPLYMNKKIKNYTLVKKGSNYKLYIRNDLKEEKKKENNK